MARLAFPDTADGPLRTLLIELHRLHVRAGKPSLDEMVKRQERGAPERFGRDTIHRLFSSCREVPKWPLLHSVVCILATITPGEDVERMCARFDQLWSAAERYEALALGLGFLYDDLDEVDGPGDRDD